MHEYTEQRIQGFRGVLEKKIKKVESGCWEWTASRDPSGYGKLGIEAGKTVLAHRLSYRIYKGAFAKELCVLHECDNPACVNPEHLFLGSRPDNSKDMKAKGRSVALLTEAQIEYLKTSSKGPTELAKELGVTKQAIFYHRKQAAVV